MKDNLGTPGSDIAPERFAAQCAFRFDPPHGPGLGLGVDAKVYAKSLKALPQNEQCSTNLARFRLLLFPYSYVKEVSHNL